MTLPDTLKFLACSWFFVRAFIKGVVTYISEQKQAATNSVKGEGLTQPLPDELPTVMEIKRAIPRHCFEPRVSTSMYYVLKDGVLIALTFAAIHSIHTLSTNLLLWWTSIVIYWGVQGTFFTAVFVLGHDCGHGSFSKYAVLNDIVGTVTHGFLMAPYYMWKLSHRQHHKNNGNIDKDEVFYPVRKSVPSSGSGVLPGFGLGTGWFGYMIIGYRPRAVHHWNPWDAMFTGHLFGCLCTVASLLTMAWLLYCFTLIYGVVGLVVYYCVPLFVFASYNVVITFLHHHEQNIPWYGTSRWDFVRGQLSTVDRHYGFVHSLLHNIGTHQMHHMFTKIPHYYLEDATTHFRAAFPHLVRVCHEPIMQSFFRMFHKYQKQNQIDDTVQLHYYK